MVKRAESPYVPGRPKGLWFKWKREPYTVDAVMMYAQRGHGKRSSFYSDYTFGVWRPGPEGGEELVPVGKAYFGFTDEELAKLDRFVRNNTTARFGPVREVTHTAEVGLVLEIAFEGLQRSTRHKSGVAMRFPRVSRIRWDKPTFEADRLETLIGILAKGETGAAPDGRVITPFGSMSFTSALARGEIHLPGVFAAQDADDLAHVLHRGCARLGDGGLDGGAGLGLVELLGQEALDDLGLLALLGGELVSFVLGVHMRALLALLDHLLEQREDLLVGRRAPVGATRLDVLVLDRGLDHAHGAELAACRRPSSHP